MTRRDLGSIVARAALAAGGQEFFGAWLEAAPGHSHAPPEPDRWTNYNPKFFALEEFRILDAFTAILIPTDETPGAREAHIAPFIDFVVNSAAEYAPEMQTEWRQAMSWLRAQNFANIEQIDRDNSPSYRLIKEMTVRAFYTSRAGLIDDLEYKGNAYLTEFPACTHPEHKKV
jgi:hypothetical protein